MHILPNTRAHSLIQMRLTPAIMLNSLRGVIEPAMARISRAAASTGLPPTAWTLAGLGCAVVAAVLFGLGNWVGVIFAGIAILVSGFFDVIDGQVARIANKESKLGAFVDSVSDKVGEVVIFAGIMVGVLADPYLVLGAVSLSLLVSYSRSRAESLGVQLQGIGIGERAERMLVIVIAAIVGGALNHGQILEYGVAIVCIIAGITFVHRVIHVTRKLQD